MPKMKWLLRPVFHVDGLITFTKYKQIPEGSGQVIVVHETIEDFREFWGGHV